MSEKRLSLEDIRLTLTEGNLEDLRDVVETSYFEVKDQPYFASDQLDAMQKSRLQIEFAKDVTALANHKGGILLLGASTESSQSGQWDVIRSIKGFDKTLFDHNTYRALLKDAIVPSVTNVEIEQRPVAEGSDKIIAWFDIPQAEEKSRPHLVARAERSGLVKGNYVGVFERTDDQVMHFSPERLHALILTGLAQTPTQDKLDRILEIVTRSNEPSAAEEKGPDPTQALQPSAAVSISSEQRMAARLDTAISQTELDSQPVLLYWSQPSGRSSLPGLFRSSSDPVIALLRDPPSLRADGFGLPRSMFTGPEAVQGERRQVVSPRGKGLFVWDDGFVVFCATAGPGFLSWGYPGSSDINPLALIESSINYFRFVNALYEHLEPKPNTITHGLRLERAQFGEQALNLYSGPLVPPHVPVSVDLREAPGSGHTKTISTFRTEPPEVVAYKLVKSVYNWFGFYDEGIPYSKGDRFVFPAEEPQ